MPTFSLATWYLALGLALVAAPLTVAVLRRLPLTAGVAYLLVGVALGPLGFDLLQLDPVHHFLPLKLMAEATILVALFNAGLKMQLSFGDRRWMVPVRLAFASMAVTVALAAVAAKFVYRDIPWGLAVLIGACVAPTDPVLASAVSVRDPWDEDPLRQALTGEAGLNDGSAFPAFLLGLGLLGLHPLGTFGWRWLLIDVGWQLAGGAALGLLVGAAAGVASIYADRKRKERLGVSPILTLGLVGVIYGLALPAHVNGFVAAFVAAVTMRRTLVRLADPSHLPESIQRFFETESGRLRPNPGADESIRVALGREMLGLNEALEEIVALLFALAVGAMIGPWALARQTLLFVPLLFLVIRPVGVWLGLIGAPVGRAERKLTMWFGVRGLGTIFYLGEAFEAGVVHAHAQVLAAACLWTVACSIAVHGMSLGSLMDLYDRVTKPARHPAGR